MDLNRTSALGLTLFIISFFAKAMDKSSISGQAIIEFKGTAISVYKERLLDPSNWSISTIASIGLFFGLLLFLFGIITYARSRSE